MRTCRFPRLPGLQMWSQRLDVCVRDLQWTAAEPKPLITAGGQVQLLSLRAAIVRRPSARQPWLV